MRVVVSMLFCFVLTLWWATTPSVAAEQCLPIDTRPSDSVALLRFPIGFAKVKAFLDRCPAVGTENSDFAWGTFFAVGGQYQSALAMLSTSSGYISDRAELLAADILFSRAEGTDLAQARFLYQELVERGFADAKVGFHLTLLRTSNVEAERLETSTALKELRDGLTLARLAAALAQNGKTTVEKNLGRSFLEQASAEGVVAAKTELAKILTKPSLAQDKARAIALLEPGVASESVEALFLAASLWKNGWSISGDAHARLLNEQALSLRHENALLLEAERTGDYDELNSFQGKRVERSSEIARLTSIHQDLVLAKTLLTKAADQGHLPSIVALGTSLAFQPTSAVEFMEGLRRFKEADRRGSPQAVERLGVLHEFVIDTNVSAIDCTAGTNVSPAGPAHGFYLRAAYRGLTRSILGADRTNERLEFEWRCEEATLIRYAKALNVPTRPQKETEVISYERNMPSHSPYFEAGRWLGLQVLKDGMQVFGARLNKGDKVRLAPNETLRLERLGDIERLPSLGRVVTRGQSDEEINVNKDPFTLVEWPAEVSSKRVLDPSGVTFKAVSGPSNAVVLSDPDWRRFRYSTATSVGPLYSDKITLFETQTVEVPGIERVTGIVRGGTDFEIYRNDILLLRMLVPIELNLYLDFNPAKLSSLFVKSSIEQDGYPNEIYVGRIPPPRAVLYANGVSIGRYYAQYDGAKDGVLAFAEFNAPIMAFSAFLKGEVDKELRLWLLNYRLALFRHGGIAVETTAAKAMIARPLARMGQLSEAIEIRDKAVQELQDFDIRPNRALIDQLIELAVLHQQHGDLSKAVIASRQALALTIGLSDQSRPGANFPDQRYGRCIRLLAQLYRAAGDYNRSYIYYRRLAGLDLLYEPDVTNNGDMDTYIAVADLALGRGDMKVSSAAGRYVLPFAKADAGQRDKSDPIARPVTVPDSMISVFGPWEKSPAFSQAFSRLGDAYWYASYPSNFSEPIYEAAVIAAMGSAGPGSALALHSAARLAMVRWMLGKDDGNLTMLKKASGQFQDHIAVTTTADISRAEMSLFNAAFIGTLDWYRRNNWIGEEKKFAEASALFEVNEHGDPFTLTFQIADLRRRAVTNKQRKALQEWTEAMASLNRLTRQLNSVAEGRNVGGNVELSAARNNLELYRRKEVEASREVTKTFEIPSLKRPIADVIDKIQQSLGEDEVVLDLLPTRYDVAAMVITRVSRRVVTFPLTDVELAQRIKSMRQALDPKLLDTQGYDSISVGSLSAVRAFTTDLMGADASKKSWIIIAHGVLRSLPFEAIPLFDNISLDSADVGRSLNQWSGLSKEISYLPSLASLLSLRSGVIPSHARQPISVVADPILPSDPRYRRSFARGLDGIHESLRQVRWSVGKWLGDLQPVPETGALGFEALMLMNGDIDNFFSGTKATRHAIMDGRQLEDSKVILFATHGETAESYPDFGEPFLVLSPRLGSSEPVDPLTASEISRMNLDADLVFLSACDTAAPDGTPGESGFSGLAQAFVSAGARTLVATQWMITTKAAALATNETLRVAKSGSLPAASLLRGRIAVAKRFGHPSFWSAFALVGDPRYEWKLSP